MDLLKPPLNQIHPDLNPLELEAVRLIAQGFSTKEISVLMNQTPRYVDHLRFNAIRKFGAKNTAELIALWSVHSTRARSQDNRENQCLPKQPEL